MGSGTSHKPPHHNNKNTAPTRARHAKHTLPPPPAQVGLVTFGTHVHVHELGFAECPKAYVFRGTKEYGPQQVQDQLGLASQAAQRRGPPSPMKGPTPGGRPGNRCAGRAGGQAGGGGSGMVSLGARAAQEGRVVGRVADPGVWWLAVSTSE
jgi:hypothetical protein